MVKIDQLQLVGQWPKAGLQVAVLAARATMDDKGRRFLTHARAIGHQAHAVDVKVNLGVAQVGEHGVPWGDKRAHLSQRAGRMILHRKPSRIQIAKITK